VFRLRRLVGESSGVDSENVDDHSTFSPWRHRLVEAVQKASGDLDVILPTWLRDGAPMGLRRDVDAGNGIFPALVSERTLDPDDVLGLPSRGDAVAGVDAPPQAHRRAVTQPRGQDDVEIS